MVSRRHAEEFGDDDEIGSAAHEGGGEGVPEDMGSGVVVEAASAAMPVMMSWAPLTPRRRPRRLRNTAGVSVAQECSLKLDARCAQIDAESAWPLSWRRRPDHNREAVVLYPVEHPFAAEVLAAITYAATTPMGRPNDPPRAPFGAAGQV